MSTLRRLGLATAAVLALSGPAAAACYADYKAKRDDPLRLHYGVIEISEAACDNPRRAASDIRRRIAGEGWQLLTVMGTFGDEGLERRRASAGDFFLRY